MAIDSFALSLVIPVYNETDNIENLVKEIETVLSKQFTYEIIVVDDGSTDGTVSRLRALTKKFANLRAIYHKHNYGQSAALVSGVRAASYPWIVTLDGDGQNDPADIPRLFDHLTDNQTVIMGIRKKRDDNLLRKLSSRIGNRVRQYFLRDGCPDTGCSLKLFPRAAFLALPHFNHLHRFLPALFKRIGLKLIPLSVNHRPRLHGMSKYGVMNRLFVGIYDLFGVRWLLRRPCSPELMDCGKLNSSYDENP